MDGTLYSFDEKNETEFTTSKFGTQIQANCVRFLQERFELSPSAAEDFYNELLSKHAGEVSLALEKYYGVDRGEYFTYTWDLPAEDFLVYNEEVLYALQELSIRVGVLTGAPRVWAERALAFLRIRELFGEAVFTGEPDIRKPNPEAFLQLARFWNLDPSQILAIGDQEHTDILPAKSLGMQTLRIAKQANTEADFSAPDIITAIALLQAKGII